MIYIIHDYQIWESINSTFSDNSIKLFTIPFLQNSFLIIIEVIFGNPIALRYLAVFWYKRWFIKQTDTPASKKHK